MKMQRSAPDDAGSKVSRHELMEALGAQLKSEGTVRGVKIGWHCHLTKLTTHSARALLTAGAELYMSECNSDTTDASAVSEMLSMGAKIFKGPESTEIVLLASPQVLADTGFVLIEKHLEKLSSDPRYRDRSKVKAASEITTSGIEKLRAASDLPLPVVNVNDGLLKSRIENFHGVGDGVVDLLRRITKKSCAGAHAAVIGYGQVGSGVAYHLRSEGAEVTVVDSDPVRMLIAHYDGYKVATLREALRQCEVVITATGQHGVIGSIEWAHCSDGQIMINVGHWKDELDVAALRKLAATSRKVDEYVEEFELGPEGKTRKIYLVANGSPANIVLLTGSDEPTLIHLTTEALCMAYLAQNSETLAHGEVRLPQEVESAAASLALKVLGI